MQIPSAEGLGNAIAPPTNLSGAMNPGAFGQQIAGGVMALGQDLLQREAKAAEKQQQEDDTQAIFEARRKLDAWERDAVFDPQEGAVAKQGRDSFELTKTLPQAFDEASSEIGGGITSPRAKQAFQQLAQSRREQVTSWADRHVLQQRERFAEQQYQADRKGFIDNAVMYASDPTSARSLSEIALQNRRTVSYLRGKGAPDSVVESSVKDNTSLMHSAVLSSMLNDGDVAKAQGYLKDNYKGMHFDDYLKARDNVKRETNLRTGSQRATETVQAVIPKLMPTDGDRLVNLVMGAESNGRRFGSDGKILEGPQTKYGTAKGEMQVLDSTNADPGFGVKPARDNSPDERARVGRDYIAAMVKRYDGDLPKALAAYNWGAGNVDEAVARAGARPGGDWLAFAPAETQSYVSKISKAYTSGQGTPPIPTLQDVHTTLRNDPALRDNPSALKTALESGTAQYNDARKAIKDQEEQAISEVSRQLVANGGKWAALSTADRQSVPPGKVDEMLNFGDRIAKGQQATDWGLYGSLVRDPNLLKATNLLPLRSQFAEAEFKQLTDKQALLRLPDTDQLTQIESARDVFNSLMRQAGIDPTPKDNDKAGAEKVGRMLSQYEDRVHAAERAKGGKLATPDEFRKVAATLFQPVAVYGTFWNSTKLGGQVDPSDKVVVPDTERHKIVLALRKAGRPVSEESVSELYRRSQRMSVGSK